jgi:hypothetical protein
MPPAYWRSFELKSSKHAAPHPLATAAGGGETAIRARQQITFLRTIELASRASAGSWHSRAGHPFETPPGYERPRSFASRLACKSGPPSLPIAFPADHAMARQC